MSIAPNHKKTQASGMHAIGTALATILGLTIGRIVGQLVGWRVTFSIIAVQALSTMFLIIRLLPNLPSKNAGSIVSLPLLAKRPLLLWLYITTAIVISAHFTAYTYIEPFMIDVGHLDPNFATAVLLVFGFSGIAASLLFNRFYRLAPTKFIVVSMSLLMFSLLLLLSSTETMIAMFSLVFIWGIGISCIGLSLQMRVLKLAPDATDVASAIYSGIFNAGIGAGALFGNQIARHVSLEYIGFTGAALAMIALGIFVFFNFHYRAQNV